MADKDIDRWKILERIDHLNEELTGVREVLNNGIVTATLENSEAIKNLAIRISELEKKISNKDAKREGQVSMGKIIIAVVSGTGSGVVGVLSILRFLGVI